MPKAPREDWIWELDEDWGPHGGRLGQDETQHTRSRGQIDDLDVDEELDFDDDDEDVW